MTHKAESTSPSVMLKKHLRVSRRAIRAEARDVAVTATTAVTAAAAETVREEVRDVPAAETAVTGTAGRGETETAKADWASAVRMVRVRTPAKPVRVRQAADALMTTETDRMNG